MLEKNTNRSKENMNREQRKVGDFMKKVPATINEQVKSGDICEGTIGDHMFSTRTMQTWSDQEALKSDCLLEFYLYK